MKNPLRQNSDVSAYLAMLVAGSMTVGLVLGVSYVGSKTTERVNTTQSQSK